MKDLYQNKTFRATKDLVSESNSGHFTSTYGTKLAYIINDGSNVPEDYQDELELSIGDDIPAGFRKKKVDLVCGNKRFYNVKLDQSDVIATAPPKDALFELNFHGDELSELPETNGLGGMSNYTARYVPPTHKSEVAVAHRSPTNAAMQSMNSNKMDEPVKTKGMSLRQAVAMQKDLHSAELNIVPPSGAQDIEGMINYQYDTTNTIKIEKNKVSMTDESGNSVTIKNGKVHIAGPMHSDTTERYQPMGPINVPAKENPIDGMVPRSNVLMPTLKYIPAISDIINTVKKTVTLIRITREIAKLVTED